MRRVDSAANGPATAFSEDAEKKFALRRFLHGYRRGSEKGGEGEEESVFEDEDDVASFEGLLGERARDSLDMTIEKSGTWESKESRCKRNRGSKFRAVRRWFRRLNCLGL